MTWRRAQKARRAPAVLLPAAILAAESLAATSLEAQETRVLPVGEAVEDAGFFAGD